MDRRRALQTLGALAGAGLAGRYALLPPSRGGGAEGARALAVRLYDSLDAEQRRRATVEYDHPYRQYYNRGVWGGGLWVTPLSMGWAQRRMLTDLLYAGLSESGRGRVPNEYFTNWPGVHAMKVLFCGDPKAPLHQIVLTGPHLNLRLGGRSREGVAFGGPLTYGDQRGDGRPGLPGNVYRYQLLTAQRLFRSLRPEERRLALLKRAPVQTQIGLQGRDGTFAGVPVAGLSPECRALARTLVDDVFSTYPPDDVAYAWRCLEQNGGPEGLHLSYYEAGDEGGGGETQIVRLEGPAAVLYFRGYPHVHAFVNVAMDGDAPLGVGEPLGDLPAPLEGEAVARLFEDAMREEGGTDFAYYNPDAVAGRLRKGPIRSGDLYALESWQDRVVHVEIKGSNLSPRFAQRLRARGLDPDPRRTYSVATTGYIADELAAEQLGQIESRRASTLVREAAIAHLKKRAAATPS